MHDSHQVNTVKIPSRYKLVLFCSLFLLSIFISSSSVEAAWYSANWPYRKAITIDNTKVAGSADLTNFPVLVNLASDTGLQTYAQSDGDDILFTSVDGTTKLDHELEDYDSTDGSLVAWIEVPTVDYDNDTIIYMYYGYASATNQQNISGAWNSNYKAVYHLSETGNGTSDEYKDSTANGNDGQGGAGNSSFTPSVTSSGKIANAQDFDGTDDFIIIPDHTSIQLGSTGTTQVWINPTSYPDSIGYGTLITKGYWDGDRNYFTIYFSGDQDISMGIGGSSARNNLTFNNSNLPLSNWRVITLTWDGSTIMGYVNGASSWSRAQSQTPDTSTYDLYLSAFNGAADFTVDGLMDEVRVIDIARSGDWLLTEYNNQNSPSTFYTLGSQEADASTITQSAYRFFANTDTTDVGSALAAQDVSTYLSPAGTTFRVRMSLHISGSTLSISGQTFKLQYARKSGTCDTSFTGETYADLTTSTPIAFYNNTTPTDGAALTDNANDPVHGGHTVVNQTYEEANNFSNTQAAIPAGEDGLWDFSLRDYSGSGAYSYCLRIVKSDSSPLDTYSVIPEVYIPPALTFTISSVGAGTVNNGITTTTASTYATLPFGDISFSTPRYMAHQLRVETNAESGYVVNMKINPGAIIQGLDPFNIIDPFSPGGISWTAPTAWQSPDGTVANVNTGWMGANTTDTRVTGWSSASQLFGPVSTNSHPVMNSTTADTGTTIYVTYALEVNVMQPTDVYTGQLEYIVIPTY